jgi:hypothetical protein
MDRALARRLDLYWKLELANAGFLPAVTLFLLQPRTALEWLGASLGTLACSALLLLGGYYWKASLARLHGDPEPMTRLLPIAARLKAPLLVLTAINAVAAALILSETGLSRAGWGILAFALLAVLEYVNYYHIQLQNFDHLPDLKRLFRTGRLRQAHLARDLDRCGRRGDR